MGVGGGRDDVIPGEFSHFRAGNTLRKREVEVVKGFIAFNPRKVSIPG